MVARSRLASALLLVAATLLAAVGSADAQVSRPGENNNQRQQPQLVVRCFVANCDKCNTFNPYICVQCKVGYQQSAGLACRSCARGYEQNLDVQTFTCSKCPAGTDSPGGTGEASQCKPISVTSGRRLFEASDEDLWA